MKPPTTAVAAGKRTAASKPARGSQAEAPLAAGPQQAAHGMQREELTRQRACAFYLERGCAAGYELEDWLKAEARVERSAATTAKTPDH